MVRDGQQEKYNEIIQRRRKRVLGTQGNKSIMQDGKKH